MKENKEIMQFVVFLLASFAIAIGYYMYSN